MSLLHPQDYEVLKAIFFPSENTDGGPVLFFAGCRPDLDLAGVAGVIDFGGTQSLPGFQSQVFHFVKNPDGSIRWLLPEGCRKPIFLKLYNGSGWRGAVFRAAFRTAFALGLKRTVMAGSLRVFLPVSASFSWQGLPVFNNNFCSAKNTSGSQEGSPNKFGGHQYAIFTGTVGENRKAVFAFKKENGEDWFFKLPLTQKAERLVQREHAALHEMNGLSFKKMELPKMEKTGTGVLLSDVRPARPKNITRLQPIHFQALEELASQTKLHLPLESLTVWKEIEENMTALPNLAIQNGLPQAKIQKIYEGLLLAHQSFDPKMKLPTVISHGDFTPWNMYLSAEKLHLYDWELSVRTLPLYDVFHFIFQSGTLIGRATFEVILERVEKLKGEETLATKAKQFDLFYRFYLLRNVSYYLVRYVRQSPLHEQAHWLVDVWLEALEAAVPEVKSRHQILAAQT